MEVASKALRLARRRWPAVLAVVLFALLCLAGYVVVLPGTVVRGLNLGGMTVSRAQAALEESLRWAGRKVTFTGNGRSLEASFERDLGVTPDFAATVRGCRRPLWLLSRRECPLVLSADQKKLASFATELSVLFDQEGRDARLGLAPGDKVVVVPEKTGRTLDFAAFEGMFLGDGRLSYRIPETIELPFTETAPRVFARDLERFLPLEKVAEFATYYAEGNDRSFNIGLACVPLSEVTIGPGETFSFNNVVGARTAECGYRKAPTFVGEETVDDFGGGVCQVSTTVYVSMLKAGFSVGERYCHTKPVDYVPMGLDATVTYDYLDLKMTNTADVPCLLRVTAKGGQLRADIYGKPSPNSRIEIESRVLKEFPAQGNSLVQAVPGRPPGTPGSSETPVPDAPGVSTPEPGGSGTPSGGAGTGAEKRLRNGFLVETIRRYVRDGRVEKVERLDTSMYPPEKPKVR